MALAASSTAQLILFFLLVSTCFLLPCSLDARETNNNPVVALESPPFSFNFEFSNASSYDAKRDLKFEGNATAQGNKVDLTCDSRESISSCTGRMSYNHPVALYDDDATLASFSTRFTFVIMANDKTNDISYYKPGDGMAFFLSGYPSSMPPNSNGGHLGLLNLNTTAAYGADQFVAVEFDTFKNEEWDPSDCHIGIDINSLKSLNTTDLPSLNGTMTATIQFNGTTGMLVTSLQFHDSPSTDPVVFAQLLPDLKSLLPRDVAVGFSASTGLSTELHEILAWSFNSTLPAPTPHKVIKKSMIIAGGALALVLLVLVTWFILSCWNWTNRHRRFEKQEKRGPTRFEYRDLLAATDHFSQDRKLGEGFFGVVYRGNLKKLRREVAVKKILNKSQVALAPDNKDFYYELNTITSVKHKNLVKLVGWCSGSSCSFVEFMCWCWKREDDKLFLVYELVPKGSLYDHLHKEETLPWERRYKIVKDITGALLYLHHECDPFILHRDIKPSNILLDNNFNAKLADFGLSRIVDPDSSRILTIPVGTEGYLDPQCRKPVGKVEYSRSSDVYSFGIVLLDIACKKDMVREQVWQQYTNGSVMQAADDKLRGEFHRNEMETVIILGLWCSYPDSKKRPSMEQVMAVLEHGKPLPDLNSLDSTSASTLQETYIDSQEPSSAGNSSYGQHA